MTEMVRTDSRIGGAINLLGGETVIQANIRGALDVHDLLLNGLPVSALRHLISKAKFLEDDETLKKAIGISLATLRRREAKIAPSRLSIEESNRLWRFVSVFGQATHIFGCEGSAEAWMTKAAIGLANRKPIDLLATPSGVAMVQDYLARLEYNVPT